MVNGHKATHIKTRIEGILGEFDTPRWDFTSYNYIILLLFLYSFNTGSVWSVVDNTSKKISIPNVCNLALASSIYMNCSSTLSFVHLPQVLERESSLSKRNIIRVYLGILAIVIEKNCWIIIHNNTLRCLLVLFLVCSWYFWPFQPDSSEFDNGLSFG